MIASDIFRTARVAPEKRLHRPPAAAIHRGGSRVNGMATKRKAISKRTRFEVFKRDGFKCQYCGAMSPNVLLQIDHIQPVSKDGSDDILNYLTACKDCNAGKSDKTLSDSTAVKKQQAQIADLHERREQLEMLLRWRDGLKDIEIDQVDAVALAWEKQVPGWHLNEIGRNKARQLVKKHGLATVLDAIEPAGDTYIKKDQAGTLIADTVELAWRKVGGICALAGLPEDERRLYYVRAILFKRLEYVPYDVMDDLKAALVQGCPVEEMVREAKHCSSWSKFIRWLQP